MPALRRHESVVAISIMALLMYTLALGVASEVASLTLPERTISNAGSVMAIGVGIYWEENCTSEVSTIDWGMLEPGTSKNVTVYIHNEGNTASTLSMETSGWTPSNASDYMTLSWDYDSSPIDPEDVLPVVFTLSVSASIEGVTSFSFDITVVGSG